MVFFDGGESCGLGWQKEKKEKKRKKDKKKQKKRKIYKKEKEHNKEKNQKMSGARSVKK